MKNKDIPCHIGIIMDGNGRWATQRNKPRNEGHKAGCQAVQSTIDAALKHKIKFLSFYAFSTENWKRDKKEVNGIFKLLEEYLNKNANDFYQKNVRLITMGDISKVPHKLTKKLEEIISKTSGNNRLIVNLGINYGGTTEIVRAANLAFSEKGTPITENDIAKNLYTAGIPSPDLIIRTSGEMRLSNFMLYQAAYSELYFPKTLWPDFGEKELEKAIRVYKKRNRRFGGY